MMQRSCERKLLLLKKLLIVHSLLDCVLLVLKTELKEAHHLHTTRIRT
jgi:hypothetical protein